MGKRRVVGAWAAAWGSMDSRIPTAQDSPGKRSRLSLRGARKAGRDPISMRSLARCTSLALHRRWTA